MKVSEVMTKKATYISPESTVGEACQLMESKDIGFLPICDGKRLIGAITDRDIALRAVLLESNPTNCSVKKIMSPDIVYIFEDQDIEEAARVMEVKQIRRLVVLDRGKKLVGIITVGDLSRESHNQSLVGEVMEHICEPDKIAS